MGDSEKGPGLSLISSDRGGVSSQDYRIMRSRSDVGYVYAVYIVDFDMHGRAVLWGKDPEYPAGIDKASMMEDWRNFNQAINKDVLDFKTGEPVERPFVSNNGRWTP